MYNYIYTHMNMKTLQILTMQTVNTHPSTITLNINGLNYSIKRHKLTDSMKKQLSSFATCNKHTSSTRKTIFLSKKMENDISRKLH